jgi:hypothetical protein
MATNALYVSFGLILSGLVMIVIGVLRRLGKSKTWYLVPNYYVLLPKGVSYALPVIGIMCTLFGVGILINNPEIAYKILNWMIIPLLILSGLIIIFQPAWFKPKWVCWLEKNHGDILGLLIEEARQTPDWRDWARRVNTQEGLEVWVAEVRRKNGLPEKPTAAEP